MERERLFSAGSTHLQSEEFARALDAEPQIRDAVRTLAELQHCMPLDTRTVAHAGSEISEWATGRGYDETAALFASLAAKLRLRDPALAFAAGRAERRCGRYDRAEEWFLRAVGLSRRSGDDAAYASAYLGWGLMEEQRGNRALAYQKYVLAWRAAMRGSFHQLGGAARHNLIALSVPDDSFDVGFSHVVAAYKLYDDSSAERLALLALDAGVFFGEHGFYPSALPLYAAAAKHISRPSVLTALYANIARAAAAIGDVEQFRSASAWVAHHEADGGEFTPGALAEISRAAYTLGLDTKALGFAKEAIKVARARHAVSAERAANEAMAVVRERRPRDVAREPPPRVSRFVRRFVNRLASLESA